MKNVNESHGAKKHNGPKNTLSAIRKGNRDAEKEIYGDGFKSAKKIHKTGKTFDRKNNKVDINNLDKYQNESKKSTLTITENDIRQMVVESVRRVVKEGFDDADTMKNVFQNIFGGNQKLGDWLRSERDKEGYFIFFSDNYEDGMNINDITDQAEPVCTLTEEDIDSEQGEVLINGEPEFVIDENTNFYADDNGSNFCQPGDLVFECNGEYAFYRPGLNTATGFVNNDAMVGTKDEIMDFINKYLRQN